MAITLVEAPQQISPVYNDCWMEVTSTNKNESGFRYIAEIFVDGVKVHETKLTPVPGTKNGRQHLSKLIGSYLSYSHLFETTDVFTKGQSVNVSLEWGEEYSTNIWAWLAYGFAGSTSNWPNYDNPQYNPGIIPRTLLYSDTEPPFVQGDTIRVNHSTGTMPPGLSGVHRVLDVVEYSSDEWLLILDLPWINTFAAATGTTDYADGQKFRDTGLLITLRCLFNGAFSVYDFRNYDYTEYMADTGTTDIKFLTTIPRSGWKVRDDSKVFVQMMKEDSFGGFDWVVGNESPVNISPPNDYCVIMLDASPPEGATEYTVHAEFSSTPITEMLKFIVDDRCYGYTDVEICFMDRLGSIIPFQFNLKSTRNVQGKVTNYTHDRDLTTGIYDYSLVDAGEEALDISEELTYTLRTARMSSDEAVMLRELITSGFTMVRFGTSDYQRCNILTRSIELKDDTFDGMRTADIEIKLSIQDPVNW